MTAAQPGNNQTGATRTGVDTQSGVNTVEQHTVYYAKFYMSDISGVNIPYIAVYRASEADDWVIIKVSKTDGMLPRINVRGERERRRTSGIPDTAVGGLTSVPIANVGDYRIYLKEPGTTPRTDTTFTIPMHALANGTDSTHEVNCWFAFTVEVAENNTNNRTLTTCLPNPQNRTGVTYGYPAINQIYTLTAVHHTAASALLLNNYALTNQLWADITQTYGSQHQLIIASPYRRALETIYNENMTAGTGRDRTLTYEDGRTQRVLYFVASSTNNASNTLKFSGNASPVDRMPPGEAIRKTHPSVFIYWLGVATDLDITRTQVTGTWRPNEGSTRHRYSLALDIDRLTANVVNGQTNRTVSVSITLRNTNAVNQEDGPRCAPTLPIYDTTPLEDRRKIEFSRVFFRRIGRDYLDQTLGWLGGPWTLYTNTTGININQLNTRFIQSDIVHRHHVHLSVSREQG